MLLLPSAFLPCCAQEKEKIEEIVLSDGRVIRGIRAIIPRIDHLIIITDDEERAIDFLDLSPEIQKRFNYDPEKAKEARLTREKKIRDAEDQRIERRKKEEARYRAIAEQGVPHIFLEKHTFTPRGGGFVRLNEHDVIPVLYDQTAVRGEIFKVPEGKLVPLHRFLAEIAEKRKTLEEELATRSEEMRNLEAQQQNTAEKLAELIAISQRTVVIRRDLPTDSAANIPRTDPLVLAQINNLRKQAKTIKQQIRDMEKRGPEQIRKELAELDALTETLAPRLPAGRGRGDAEATQSGQAPAPVPSDAPSTVNVPSDAAVNPLGIRDKLLMLKKLYDEKLISEEEYRKRRDELLSGL